MKKTTLFKAISFTLALTLVSMLALLPISAAETSANPGIILKDFNGNDIVRTIVNAIVGLLALFGAVYGGWQLAQGLIGQDPKEKQQGILTLIGSLLIGGLILVIVNMMLK